ncbi:prokaryotic molybdopterin-containing oxidoreductase family, iron-sulfur binding subunit [Halobiforma haloterrestris]|uniref:Prokaryotic molybdopterin-containing oxidoreductase family, iron-sulfur binding subunit n=1 Tax=Natronobacterium haloterrestre TaxID=148448 RepID=A0A1I1KNW4_NATHA|nr:4Fe-4S ferredoxin N-terminal domain-containing protein [Halobiforma haloterrestris]SFC62469.1 prokaryotic molybdopterin-containing oxidoreductase family, iron-sulfur binding subunit [Halobiforma haloterrestris]
MSDAPDDATDDDAFHPLGETAEADFEAMLEETEYDAELGMEMAKDAMRLTKGEITEEEFYDRYHEDVLEEFGEDERPMADRIEAAREEPDDPGAVGELLSTIGGDESRRKMMKKMGAGASAVGLGAFGASKSPDPPASVTQEEEDDGHGGGGDAEAEGTQWGMALDLEVCDGCLSCVVACNAEHNWNQGANWMYILAYDDGLVESPEAEDYESTRDFNYLIRPCQHCTDAPCEKVCPTTARHTRDDGGLVLTDYDVCIGCRYCQVACPYGVNYFKWDDPNETAQEMDSDMQFDKRDRWVSGAGPRGVMEKCVFDPPRQDGQMGEDMVGTTACEEACPPGAIQFGDMHDPESDPQQYLENVALARAREHDPEDEELQDAIAILEGEEEPAESEDADGMTEDEAQGLLEDEYGDGTGRFKLLEEYNTNPNVTYIGNEPGPHAEQVPGPVAYDDVGMTDVRKDELDEKTVGGELGL